MRPWLHSWYAVLMKLCEMWTCWIEQSMKVSKFHMEQLRQIVHQDEVFEQDKDILWLMRYELRDHHPHYLSRLWLSVRWNSPVDVAKVFVFCYDISALIFIHLRIIVFNSVLLFWNKLYPLCCDCIFKILFLVYFVTAFITFFPVISKLYLHTICKLSHVLWYMFFKAIYRVCWIVY